MSRQGEVTISHYTGGLQSHENLWGSVVMYDDDEEEEQGYTDKEEEQLEEDEEESGVILSVITEADLEELGIRQRVFTEENEAEGNDSHQFEGEGSGYIVQEDFSESDEEEGFGGREDELSDVQQVIRLNQREGEVLQQMFPSAVSLQRELQPGVSEEEVENRKHPGRGEEDDRAIASEVEWKNDDEDLEDDREMTWYFTWR